MNTPEIAPRRLAQDSLECPDEGARAVIANGVACGCHGSPRPRVVEERSALSRCVANFRRSCPSLGERGARSFARLRRYPAPDGRAAASTRGRPRSRSPPLSRPRQRAHNLPHRDPAGRRSRLRVRRRDHLAAREREGRRVEGAHGPLLDTQGAPVNGDAIRTNAAGSSVRVSGFALAAPR